MRTLWAVGLVGLAFPVMAEEGVMGCYTRVFGETLHGIKAAAYEDVSVTGVSFATAYLARALAQGGAVGMGVKTAWICEKEQAALPATPEQKAARLRRKAMAEDMFIEVLKGMDGLLLSQCESYVGEPQRGVVVAESAAWGKVREACAAIQADPTLSLRLGQSAVGALVSGTGK